MHSYIVTITQKELISLNYLLSMNNNNFQINDLGPWAPFICTLECRVTEWSEFIVGNNCIQDSVQCPK